VTQIEKPEIRAEILENLRRWAWIANSLRFTQVTLGIVATASALTVTTFTDELGTFWVKICSFLAAFCIGILVAFDIGGKANKTRRAWRHLNTAILRYQSIPASSLDNLIDSYSQAEAIVGDVEFRQPENIQKS
jgi:hypothetical protein